MLTQPVRFSNLRNAIIVFVTAAILIGAILMGWGVSRAVRADAFWERGLPPMAAGALVIVASVTILVFGWLLLKIESHSHRQYNQLLDVCDRLNDQMRLLASIVENVKISDTAKGIAHRDEEREAIRGAIQEEISRQDWEAALYLVDQMRHRFGTQEEADRLSQQVVEARTSDMRDRLDEALERIEERWRAHEWDRAAEEIERLIRALPDDKRTVGLREEHAGRREAHKQELLATWETSVRHSEGGEIEVDQAIGILKELDQYLTRAEARALEESARGVFKAKLIQFGVQFEYAVKDARWRDALEIGIQITEEFPNSRMAHEVREMERVLRQRAGLSGDVDIITRPAPSPGK